MLPVGLVCVVREARWRGEFQFAIDSANCTCEKYPDSHTIQQQIPMFFGGGFLGLRCICRGSRLSYHPSAVRASVRHEE